MAFRIVSKRITWFQFPVVSIGSFLLCAVILLLPVDQGRPQNTDVSFKSNSVKTISQLGPDKRKVFAKLYDRGARAIMQQNAKEALEAFQQAATVWPEHPDVHYQLGVLYQNQSLWQEAAQHFQKTLQHDSAYVEAYPALAHAYIRALARSANAVVLLQQGLNIHPQHALMYRLLGTAYRFQHQLNDAQEALQQSIRLNPTDGETYYQQGIVHFKKRNDDLAIKSLKKAIQFESDTSPPYYMLAQAYMRNGDRKNAEAFQKLFKRIHRQSEKMFLLKRAVDVNPSNSQNWYRLAQAYFENQDLGSGLDVLNRAIQLQPENLSYHQLRGKVYLQVQALDYAIDAFQTVIGLEPSQVSGYINLGMCYYLKEDYSKSVEVFLTAKEMDPENPGVHLNLANAYSQVGDRRRAQEAYHIHQSLKGR